MSAARPTLGIRGASLNPHEGGSAGRRSRKRARSRLEEVVPRSRHALSCPITIPALCPASSLDGEADGLVAQSRERIRLRLGDRERLSSLVVGGAFLAAAIPLAVLPSSERSPSFLLIAALVAAYAVGVARAVRGRRRLRDPDAARARADAVRGADRAGAAARPARPRRGRAAVEHPPRRAAGARDRRAGGRVARGRAGGRPARRRRGPGGVVALAGLPGGARGAVRLRLRERLVPRVARVRDLAARAPALRGLGLQRRPRARAGRPARGDLDRPRRLRLRRDDAADRAARAVRAAAPAAGSTTRSSSDRPTAARRSCSAT